MRVYQFIPTGYAIEALVRRRIRVSRVDDLNDPFELLGRDLPTKDDRLAFNRFKRRVNQRFGVLCFSKNWKNPLLWSHYAEKHKGLCLGFDISPGHLKQIR